MAYDPNKRADVFMTVEGPDKAPRTAPKSLVTKQAVAADKTSSAPERTKPKNEFEEQFGMTVWDEIIHKLRLLEVPVWISGHWANEPEGWRDKQTGMFLHYNEAVQLLQDRISELGLDADRIHKYVHSTKSMLEVQAFDKLSFEIRMQKFRAAD
jgi:hypothetical protein